jgi:hypothetical protein
MIFFLSPFSLLGILSERSKALRGREEASFEEGSGRKKKPGRSLSNGMKEKS